MRRALAAAVLGLALAACSVDVEGAPCGTPGATADCPSGQACGNDGRCSARAASCERCTPGDSVCGGGDGTTLARTCTGGDPVCGSWSETDCGALGLVCGTRSAGGAAACECPAGFEGPEFAADPAAGSASGTAPFPTGAASPPQCRFRRLGDAISRAAGIAGDGTVQAYGAAGAPVVFDAATGDGAITIAANVTVKAAPSPAGDTVLRPAAASGETIVTLAGRIEGLRIEKGSADAVAVATSCVGSGRPTLKGVDVAGDHALTVGVDVAGSCGADLIGVEVSGVNGPALRIRADAAALVNVTGGALQDSSVGLRVTGGKVAMGAQGDPLASVTISGNAAEGVLLTGTTTAVEAQLDGASIFGNGGTGVVVDVVSASSKLTIRGCDVSSNGQTAARSYGGATVRKAGGVLLRQSQLAAFTFTGNRVFANWHDQLAFESSGAWSISPGACGGSSNVFRCASTDAYAVSLAGTGSVNAAYSVWPVQPPDTAVNGAVTTTGWCSTEAGLPAPPQCVAP